MRRTRATRSSLRSIPTTRSNTSRRSAAHEDRYAIPPELEAVIDGEITQLAIDDLSHYSDRLTEKQSFVWRHTVEGYSLGDIAEMIQEKDGRTISASSVGHLLQAARKNIIKMIAGDPYHGWYIVYLETITGHRLYAS